MKRFHTAKCSYKPLVFGGIDDELRQKAKDELNETEENVKEGKRKFRQLLLDKGMPYHDNDAVLIEFLRVKKFKPKGSYDLLMNSMKSHRIVRKTYGMLDPDVVKTVLSKDVIGLLPHRDAEGAAIAFCRSGSYINAGLSYADLTQATIFIAFYLAEQPASQVAGISLIIDAKEACVPQLRDILRDARVLLPQLRGYAARVKSIHVLNEPSYIKLVLEVVKLFVPKKIMNRIILHGSNVESLHKYYEPAILPKEFGGTCGKLNNDHWIEEVDATMEMYRRYNDIALNVKNF